MPIKYPFTVLGFAAVSLGLSASASAAGPARSGETTTSEKAWAAIQNAQRDNCVKQSSTYGVVTSCDVDVHGSAVQLFGTNAPLVSKSITEECWTDTRTGETECFMLCVADADESCLAVSGGCTIGNGMSTNVSDTSVCSFTLPEPGSDAYNCHSFPDSFTVVKTCSGWEDCEEMMDSGCFLTSCNDELPVECHCSSFGCW